MTAYTSPLRTANELRELFNTIRPDVTAARIYLAEQWLDGGAVYIRDDDIDVAVQQLVNDTWFRSRFPHIDAVTVTHSHRMRYDGRTYPGGRITFRSLDTNHSVVDHRLLVHELAHVVSGSGHGTRFVTIYDELLGHCSHPHMAPFTGCAHVTSFGAREQLAFRFGLRVEGIQAGATLPELPDELIVIADTFRAGDLTVSDTRHALEQHLDNHAETTRRTTTNNTDDTTHPLNNINTTCVPATRTATVPNSTSVTELVEHR